MAEKKQAPEVESNPSVERITGFWNQYSKQILIAVVALVVIVGGIWAYNSLIAGPKEKSASEAIRTAESFFRKDSVKLALEGDAINPGFLKIISKYSGTKAANLAHFYAGSCYLTMGDFKNAAKQLEEFNTSDLMVKARAKALLADANSELGKKDEAVKLYKEAGTTFEKDDKFSPQYLVRAALLYETMGKKQEAIDTYKLIKEKYPLFREFDVDKYLAKLGYIAE